MIIGLVGRIGSGKDTVGQMIQAERDYLRPTRLFAFAEPLKQICQDVYEFSDDQLSDRKLKEAPDTRYPREDGSFLTPREAMQLLGSEWGRRCYPNTWSDLALRKALKWVEVTSGASGRVPAMAVFTDCRFITEAKAIRAAGGKVWRILRPEADAVNSRHVSETEMNTPEFKLLVDRLIPNAHSLEELRVVIGKALEELK